MILRKDFYACRADVVARTLLGKHLVSPGVSGIITETEAYMGPHDKASHAHKGRTARTEPMFGPAGIWYVYLCYGMHWMLNIVTGPEDYPAAVLIRGVVNVSGPGRLTKQFGITGAFNAQPAARKTGLWIEDRLPAQVGGVRITPRDIQKTPRIGVAYAEEWAEKPLRFIVASRHGRLV